MRTLSLLILAFAGNVCASGQSADAPQYYFDCDAAAAHESSWASTVSAQSFVVTGTVALLEAREDPTWVPGFSLRIVGKGDAQRAGLIVARDRAEPHALKVGLLEDTNLNGRVSVGELKATNTPLPFSLEVSKSGDVKLSIGEVVATTRITKFPVKGISLGCTTGEVEFDRVIVRER